MQNTKIQWCNHTFNPWYGCTKVSPACDNCYAEVIAKRFFKDAKWGNYPRVLTNEANWKAIDRLNRKAYETGVSPKVFCGSMCDVFDNKAPEHIRNKLINYVHGTPYITWLLLTKRISNVGNNFVGAFNTWLGITVCNQEEADRDIPKLLQTPAAKRFLSIEPMLDEINIKPWLQAQFIRFGVLNGKAYMNSHPSNKLDWVIVGGETGRNTRPMHPDWARSIRDQCKAASIPFFFKQWGEYNELGKRVGTKKSGCLLDGHEYKEFPHE